ncbi:MAG: OmpA family protein [Methylococcales bacterium]|nr:OmpA family protein [Methylococcales bacterium]
MNKQCVYLTFAALVTALAACTPPAKDVPGLTSEIDAAVAGHYGQSIYHEELAEEKLEKANRVLKHWKKGYYWNIDERQKGMDAAQQAAQHRLESEKELCQWLTEVHGPNHHQMEATEHTAAYFKTGSAAPYKTEDRNIAMLGKYLAHHPDATAEVIAYTDTVGSPASNQNLSERRAAAVSQMLVGQGAKMEQLHMQAMGEAQGPDNTPDQKHRTVSISTSHPEYVDCPDLK